MPTVAPPRSTLSTWKNAYRALGISMYLAGSARLAQRPDREREVVGVPHQRHLDPVRALLPAATRSSASRPRKSWSNLTVRP